MSFLTVGLREPFFLELMLPLFGCSFLTITLQLTILSCSGLLLEALSAAEVDLSLCSSSGFLVGGMHLGSEFKSFGVFSEGSMRGLPDTGCGVAATLSGRGAPSGINSCT